MASAICRLLNDTSVLSSGFCGVALVTGGRVYVMVPTFSPPPLTQTLRLLLSDIISPCRWRLSLFAPPSVHLLARAGSQNTHDSHKRTCTRTRPRHRGRNQVRASALCPGASGTAICRNRGQRRNRRFFSFIIGDPTPTPGGRFGHPAGGSYWEAAVQCEQP